MSKNNKWLCFECGQKKEEYESMYCDKCWGKIQKEESILNDNSFDKELNALATD